MKIALPDELKKWCYYDVSKFSWQLKEEAPKEIVKKFKEFQDVDIERYKMQKD